MLWVLTITAGLGFAFGCWMEWRESKARAWREMWRQMHERR